MTRDEVIAMARECGWIINDELHFADQRAIQSALLERLQHFAALVNAKTKEADAKAVEALLKTQDLEAAMQRVDAARRSGTVDSLLLAMEHESTVRFFDIGIQKALAAIRTRGEGAS